MSPLQQAEADILNFAASALTANAAGIEADLGPVEVIAVNDGIKLADEVFAKLPLGLGAIVDAAFGAYASRFTPAELNGYVGQGLDLVIEFLKASATKIAG